MKGDNSAKVVCLPLKKGLLQKERFAPLECRSLFGNELVCRKAKTGRNKVVFLVKHGRTFTCTKRIHPLHCKYRYLESRGIVKDEYLVIILGYFFLFLHKNICCGYSLEVLHQGASNEYPKHVFMANWRKLSHNYHQILLLNNSCFDHRSLIGRIF